ncbi:acyl carrier protein [Micromonospora haikouensis]|uniref:acyl carrier protein n=1 Tax=Micromonospora haikouensis TaxID=686309 RepID=UPI003D71434D
MADSSLDAPGVPSLDGPATEVIAAILTELLRLDSVDPYAGFFDLGVTSATLVRMVRILRGRWPEIRIVDIFDNPTAEQLAVFLEKA